MCPADCRGHCGDGSSKGLGNSQKGEVAWLQEQGVPIAHYGIEQFEELVKCAREQGDGAAAYWDQVRPAVGRPAGFCFVTRATG